MTTRGTSTLPMADKAFLDNPALVLIRPVPTTHAIGGGKNLDLRAAAKVGHKVGLVTGLEPRSDGPRRRLTFKAAGYEAN